MRPIAPDAKVRSWVVGTLVAGLLAGSVAAWANEKQPTVAWHTDYARAMELADQQGRSLLIYYYQPGKTACGECFDCLVKTDKAVAARLLDFVCVRIPASATIRVDGKEVKLLEHDAFSSLHGNPGIAILDLAHKDSPTYGSVAGTLPFDDQKPLPQQLTRLLCGSAGEIAPHNSSPIDHPSWLTDYTQGMDVARRQAKMMLVYFRDGQENQLQEQFETATLSDANVQQRLSDYVCVRIPCDASITVERQAVRLLDTPAFAEMLGRPGVAILDFAHRDAPYYEDVVSTFPLLERHPYTPDRMVQILALPAGTLTQRTLIYAVRVHTERPQSTLGQHDNYLSQEAQSHSQYQAQIRVQGHHQWGSRFQRILSFLPLGLTASEVCAESWPGDNLLEAAIECVRCWRTSSGHWHKVSSPHPVYGYDMKKGANGIWYATGIFGDGTLR
jgi:hypothetical protein